MQIGGLGRRQVPLGAVGGGRHRHRRVRRGDRPPLLDDGLLCLRDVDHLHRDRLGRAGLHASRGLTLGQSVGAHVALAHDAAATVEARHLVGTHEDAVATADALVGKVADDAGVGILLVGVHWAPLEAAGLDTVVARGGHVLLEGLAASGLADEEADRAPRLVGVQPVEAAAGGHTRLTAGADIEVHVGGVLLPVARRRGGHEGPVVARSRQQIVVVVAGEPLRSGGIGLLLDEPVDQRLDLRPGSSPCRLAARRATGVGTAAARGAAATVVGRVTGQGQLVRVGVRIHRFPTVRAPYELAVPLVLRDGKRFVVRPSPADTSRARRRTVERLW